MIDHIVSDIDGTLISEGRLPPENRAALADAVARGVRLTLATVRKFDSTEQVVQQLDLPCMRICQGGAAIYDHHGQPLRVVRIPLDLARAVAETADAHALPLITTIDEVNYYPRGLPAPLYVQVQGVDVPNNRAVPPRAPTRFLVRGEAGVQLLMERFAGTPLRFVRHYLPDGALYDAAITSIEATKERALAWLCEHTGIDLAGTLAIGDAESDIGMLRMAGVGVAVGDAQPVVRAEADWVAPPAAVGGVAAAVRHFVLSTEGGTRLR